MEAGAVGVLLVLVAGVVVAAAWHISLGTSDVGMGDLVRLALGDDSAVAQGTRNVLFGSRLPRLAAGITVGFALGVAGALLQSLARNPIASPDTLAVTGGSYLAVTLAAVVGGVVPVWASGAVAFVGGLLAAGLVLGLAGGAGTSTTRVVLAGSAVALALQSATSALLILFEEETTALFAWGSGSLSQLGLTAFGQAAPVVVGATAGALVLARRLDLLGLGEDTAAVLGVPVARTRATATVLAVVLTATSVTLAGPIGFVGLFAPALVRLLGTRFPGLLRHHLLLAASGAMGALAVLLADCLVRALIGAEAAIAVPTGVVTTLTGAVFLVLLARRSGPSGPTDRRAEVAVTVRSGRRFAVVVTIGVVAVASVVVVGLLAGHVWLRTGDLALWLLGGDLPDTVRLSLQERGPRVAAAVAAGGALALAGSVVQTTCRNPLAEPGILGVTGGAGLAAVMGLTLGSASSNVLPLAVVGALATFGAVYRLAWRGGMDSDRLVLVGIGTWYGTTALSTYLLVRSNPWDTPRIFTWLAGSTYGRTWEQVVPVAGVLAVGLVVCALHHRELDLLGVDDDTPRLAGVRLERARWVVLTTAALLAAASVVAVGVVAFVGLIAPHGARMLVGGRHARSLPVAVLAGATLLGVADMIGRTVIAPAQLPAGLVVALVGTPYFVFLLMRSRA